MLFRNRFSKKYLKPQYKIEFKFIYKPIPGDDHFNSPEEFRLGNSAFKFQEKEKKPKEFGKIKNFIFPYNEKYDLGKFYTIIILEDSERKKIMESQPTEIINTKIIEVKVENLKLE